MKLIACQITEYDQLLMLATSLNQPQQVKAISEAKTRIYTTKRKYDDCYTAEDSSNKVVNDNDAETSEVAEDFGSREKRQKNG